VTWNLRTPAATAAGGPGGGAFRGRGAAAPPIEEEESGPAAAFAAQAGGGFVLPGMYKVSLATRQDGVTKPLGVEQTITVVGEASAPPKVLVDFEQKVRKLQIAMAGTMDAANTARTQLTAIERALVDSSADLKLLDEARGLDKRLTAILRTLRGDETLRGLESGTPASIQSRIQSITGGTRNMISPPTGTQQMNYQIAAEALPQEQTKLKQLEADLKRLEAQLDALGVAYTPGRMPEFRER